MENKEMNEHITQLETRIQELVVKLFTIDKSIYDTDDKAVEELNSLKCDNFRSLCDEVGVGHISNFQNYNLHKITHKKIIYFIQSQTNQTKSNKSITNKKIKK